LTAKRSLGQRVKDARCREKVGRQLLDPPSLRILALMGVTPDEAERILSVEVQ
jgi:hypothetical protein